DYHGNPAGSSCWIASTRPQEGGGEMKERTCEELKKETEGVVKPMSNWSRVIVETDEKSPKLLAVITNKDCETAQGLRVRLKPSID
ncbi:hypothetical protein, partial [Limosilactobacillus antri]|uniref:hypothetical protein n=1 Tax=Limosilactobacillus antri TaxID=227943 RepID=UPI001F58BB94